MSKNESAFTQAAEKVHAHLPLGRAPSVEELASAMEQCQAVLALLPKFPQTPTPPAMGTFQNWFVTADFPDNNQKWQDMVYAKTPLEAAMAASTEVLLDTGLSLTIQEITDQAQRVQTLEESSPLPSCDNLTCLKAILEAVDPTSLPKSLQEMHREMLQVVQRPDAFERACALSVQSEDPSGVPELITESEPESELVRASDSSARSDAWGSKSLALLALCEAFEDQQGGAVNMEASNRELAKKVYYVHLLGEFANPQVEKFFSPEPLPT